MGDPIEKMNESTTNTDTGQNDGQSNRQSSLSSPTSNGGSIDFAYIQQRALSILKAPATAWEEIKAESLEPMELCKRYIFVMAAIPAVATYIGMVLFGISIPFTNATYTWPVFGGLVTTLVTYLTSLASLFVGAFIVEKLSSKFDTESSFGDGFRLFAFAMTPVYVGGALSIIPALSILGALFGFYGLYILYKGFPIITNVKSERQTGFFAASLVCTVIAMIVLSVVTSVISPVSATPELGSFSTSDGTAPKIEFGGVTIDPNKLEQSMKNLESMMPKSAGNP